MLRKNFGYDVVIERGHSPPNDAIIDFLRERVAGYYLDVGCNTGWLLSEVPRGVGIDATSRLVGLARRKGLNVVLAWAEQLPFPSDTFDVVVLSCILEQSQKPDAILSEALRVGRKVIGVTPYSESPWGRDSRSPWVKSVLELDAFGRKWGAYIESCIETHWYFEICQ